MSLQLETSSGLNLVAPTAAAGLMVTGLSGAATTYSSPAKIYMVNGVPNWLAAVSGGTTPTTDGNTALAATLLMSPSQVRTFAWAINAAGTTAVFAGPVVTWANSSGTATGSPISLSYPSVPSTYAVFAVHYIATGSNLATVFRFGTDNWNTTGVTVGTVTSCGGFLPNTPLVSP